jgi:hypothetical protein
LKRRINERAVEKPNCLSWFVNKKGNDSGFYLYPLIFNMQKQVDIDKIRQKKEKHT